MIRFYSLSAAVGMGLVCAFTSCKGETEAGPPPSGDASTDGAGGVIEDGPGGATDGSTPTCTLPAARGTIWNDANPPSCPAGCVAVPAMEVNAAGTCRQKVLLGCLACADGCGGAPEGPCQKFAADGRLVFAPPYATANNSGFVACSAAEQDTASLPLCAQ